MSLNVIRGKIKPIRDRVLISDMEFGDEKTQSGIVVLSGNGKSSGIKPRWGRVFAIGPEQEDVKVGEWIYVDHGRWSRGVTIEDETGTEIIIRLVDNKDILLSADTPPEDVLFNNL
jgi:co-chaperonin GroES (HSP10)